MDNSYEWIDITARVFARFTNKIDKRIRGIRLIHGDEVYLEITRAEMTTNGHFEEAVIYNDLSIIMNVDEDTVMESSIENQVFSIKNPMEDNLNRILESDYMTLIHCTDLFDEVIADRTIKKERLFKVLK